MKKKNKHLAYSSSRLQFSILLSMNYDIDNLLYLKNHNLAIHEISVNTRLEDYLHD